MNHQHFFLDDEGLRHLLGRIKNYFASQAKVNSDLNDLLSRINNLDSSKVDKEDYAQDLADTNSAIDTINRNIDSLEETKADKSTVNTEIARIDSSLTNLGGSKVDVSTYNSDKSTIQSSIDSLGTSISSLESKHDTDVSNIQSSLDEIEGDISGLGSSKLDQSTYDTDKSEIDSEISGIQESLTNLGNSKASKDELNTEVERIDGSISTVNESIEGINSSIESIDSSISDVNESIGDINSSIETINTSIGTINGSIESLEESVEGLDTSVSALESSVQSIEGSIDDLGDSLSPVATSGSYNDLENKPEIPAVNNPTITFTQGGTTKGTITLNQSEDSTIALDAGGSGGESPDISALESRMDDVEDTVSDFQQTIENYELNNPVTRSEVTAAVNNAEGRTNDKLTAHENKADNPHKVTYNQVGLEVVEDIESEPEESEEPEYQYVASIDYVKQYVGEKGVGIETLENLEGSGREGILYIYGETLYIWKDGEEGEDGEFTAVSTASSGVSRELEEKINIAYEHTSDTTTNPHQISKATINLGNVDNTSDIDKPVSNATMFELVKKVNVSEIVNNLTTRSARVPLSANMGWELNSQVSALDSKVRNLGTVLTFMGNVSSRSELSSIQNPSLGDCYQVLSADGQDPDDGHMFSYASNNTWVEISTSSIDLGFVTASIDEVQTIIDSYHHQGEDQGGDGDQSGNNGEGENNNQEPNP